MDHLDRLIECAARVKQLREQLRVAEQELATAAAGHRPRSSNRSAHHGARPQATRPTATRLKATRLKAAPAAKATSVSGRVREHMRASPTKTYDAAALMADLKLPDKNVRLVRSLLKRFTNQRLLMRVDRGQYRWRAQG